MGGVVGRADGGGAIEGPWTEVGVGGGELGALSICQL